MMKSLGTSGRRALIAVAAWHLGTLAYFVFHLLQFGYLPPPAFAFVDDTFADFFHTTYWAYHDERYSEWLAVHPPFVFAIAQLVSFKECFLFEGLASRDGCGRLSLYLLLGITFAAAFVNARLFSDDLAWQILCFVTIASSFPILYAIERGNFILFGYSFVVLSVATKSRVAQGFFLACAISVKQYLIVLLGFAFLKMHWRAVISCGISGLALLAISAAYLPAPDFLRFIENMFAFVGDENIGNLWRLPYSTSVNGFISFSKTADAQYFFDALVEVLPFLTTDLIFYYARTLQIFVFALICAVVVGLFRLQNRISDSYISFASLICLFNLSDATAAYALIMLLAYLPTVREELSRKDFAALFLLFQPADGNLLVLGEIPGQLSYLSGETVTSTLAFTYGSIVRPGALLLLLSFVALHLWATKGEAASDDQPAHSGAPPSGHL